MATSRWVVVLAGLAPVPLAGCGATGLSWVGEAHVHAAQHTVASASTTTVRAPLRVIPASAEQEAEEAPRPRLSRTVTLGESELVGPGARSGSASSPSSGTSITINNYNVLNAPTVGYGYARAYGWAGANRGYFSAGSGYSRPSSASAPGGSSPQAGQNWPAISDHGPSFPMRSAPAAPWSRTP